ncbi:Hypothetical predicted protein [Podarcis lilfordi]|uniref:Uncharacterized protein n=1 Tax=Podarcis lilfordi TaxID=74358 RepID=A0AA35PI00_9SAUR|nr:Hypothetical predicted protein [Podarcis lilfordi]
MSTCEPAHTDVYKIENSSSKNHLIEHLDRGKNQGNMHSGEWHNRVLLYISSLDQRCCYKDSFTRFNVNQGIKHKCKYKWRSFNITRGGEITEARIRVQRQKNKSELYKKYNL